MWHKTIDPLGYIFYAFFQDRTLTFTYHFAHFVKLIDLYILNINISILDVNPKTNHKYGSILFFKKKLFI